MTFRVVDLFCGPGGISEGLRQASFATVYALDKDRAAADTFAKNHPEARVVRQDVTGIDPDDLPDFDVLVGGPPCIEFSNSKGSKGNILEGLRLVQEFLRVVHERSPRYWIMENVPRIILHLPDEIPLRWIGINKPGSLHVPVRTQFQCADFGVPQTRKRFLMGKFPVPAPTNAATSDDPDLFEQSAPGLRPWATLGEMIHALPDPLKPRPSGTIRDPNYLIEIPASELTDHFHPVILNEREVRQIRNGKLAHPYMGKMAFPDQEDRPARTVVATQLGRETLVLRGLVGRKEVFRRATVRECATLQSFPLTYQFFAGSLNARYRLAGDAVPPRLTYLIGRAIRAAEGESRLRAPRVRPRPLEIAPEVTFKPRTRKSFSFPIDRKFARLVPGKEVRGCRVELDNTGVDPRPAQLANATHVVSWEARLYVGEGKKVLRTEMFSLERALAEVAGQCAASEDLAVRFGALLRDGEARLAGKVPDATTLQACWTGRKSDVLGPQELVDVLSDIIERHFPARRYSKLFMSCSGASRIIPERGLRIRLAAALVLTAYCAELINNDTRWAEANPKQGFLDAPIDKGSRKPTHLDSPVGLLAHYIRTASNVTVFGSRFSPFELAPRKVSTARSA